MLAFNLNLNLDLNLTINLNLTLNNLRLNAYKSLDERCISPPQEQ